MTINQEEIIKNNFESKVSIKIETNSRGYNTSIHCYHGVSEEEIDDTIAKAVYGLCEILIEVARDQHLMIVSGSK